MPLPANALRQVQTYQTAGLAYLQNAFCFISDANKKYQNFQTLVAQLGDTVSFNLPTRYIGTPSLVAVSEATKQRIHYLTVDQQESVFVAFSAQQFVFNVKQYMDEFGKDALVTLGNVVEASIAQNCIDHTYRFYGDGVTAINSFGQLGKALAYFRNYGAARDKTRAIVSDMAVPDIINSGLNQFVMKRNEDIAQSWELGTFSRCDWQYSNLLKTHTAGTVGQAATTLTVVSTDDPTGDNITQITFSGAGLSDPDAIKSGDLLQFQDGVSGHANVRYLTFTGYQPSQNSVQVRATANAGSGGTGQVTVSIYPALCMTATNSDRNITANIVAGMQVKALPSHRAGLIYSGDALYLGMPRLPDESPFITSNEIDPETGASFRMYYGSKFGLNERGMIHDCIWGSTLVDEYAMRVVFPL